MGRRNLTDAPDPVARHRIALVRAPAIFVVAVLPLTGFGPEHAPVRHQHPAARVTPRLADTSPVDRARVQTAAAGPGRPYILKAYAAGHSPGEVVRFAQLIRGKSPAWLRAHLSLINLAGPPLASYGSSPVRQTDKTTCGSMTILMARAIADPLYTFYLTTGGSSDRHAASGTRFTERLAAEEHRIHDATNTVWPQRLGSTPSGLSNELNRDADAFGTRYHARLIGPGDRGAPALRAAVTAARNGQPVPVLIGDWMPRHYLLLTGWDKGDLVFYEPTRATLIRVSEGDFLDGTMGSLAHPHIHAVITPSR